MQQWSPEGVRLERTAWRDQDISLRHREWGFNCPAVDLDFLVAEYNVGKPVALIEYKHYLAREPSLLHPTYRALMALADGYTEPLPFLIAFYRPDLWAFRVTPVNNVARRHFTQGTVLSEFDFVCRLYRMRRLTLSRELEGKLNRETPNDIEWAVWPHERADHHARRYNDEEVTL